MKPRTFALVIALLLLVAQRAAFGQGVSLRIPGLYHPPVAADAEGRPSSIRPITASIEGAGSDQRFAILLLAPDGSVVARAEASPGRELDLAKAMPAIAAIRVAHWLQIAKEDAPVGTPWVVQPLIARPALRTVEALRPDGTTRYTRIVGWGDRPLDPDDAEVAKLRPSWTPGDPAPPSGFRIYPDRDVLLRTEEGEIRIALAPDRAPNTAWNFRTLVEGGFYDRTGFHRIVKYDREGRPFVIQGGDPTGSGDGGPGYDLPLEPSDLPHDVGVISMARADHPDSAGSQFFLCLSRVGTARLDGQYCAFGWAVSGSEAIAAIADREIADRATGRPRAAPLVREARLVPAPPRSPGVGRPDRRIGSDPEAPALPERPARVEPDR